MAAHLYKMRCINPEYLKVKFEELKTFYNNPRKSLRPRGYHYVCLKADCLLFDTGNLNAKYRFIDLQCCGIRASINVSVFVFFMYNDMKKSCLGLDKGAQLSHLCHHPACINPRHLNIETAQDNNKRKECAKQSSCIGHKEQPSCHF